MDQTKVAIVAIRYLEPDWEQTKECLVAAVDLNRQGWEATKGCLVAAVDLNRQGDSGESPLPIHYIDRSPPGTGSLAEAINRGFIELLTDHRSPITDYIWFVTNITFAPGLLPMLVAAMDANPDYAA